MNFPVWPRPLLCLAGCLCNYFTKAGPCVVAARDTHLISISGSRYASGDTHLIFVSGSRTVLELAPLVNRYICVSNQMLTKTIAREAPICKIHQVQKVFIAVKVWEIGKIFHIVAKSAAGTQIVIAQHEL